MFVIKSEKLSVKNGEPFQALSETNNSVEFHNQLFDTDDCVITEEPNENFIEVVAEE
jgi:hypothetical protein